MGIVDGIWFLAVSYAADSADIIAKLPHTTQVNKFLPATFSSIKNPWPDVYSIQRDFAVHTTERAKLMNFMLSGKSLAEYLREVRLSGLVLHWCRFI